MKHRLPEIYLNKSAVLDFSIPRKRQGALFQLHLKDRDNNQMNSAFTVAYKDRHYKTSIDKKKIRDIQTNYRTIQLKVNQYEISKQKKALSSQIASFKSAKIHSYSLQKNPETCQSFHEGQQIENVNSIIENKKQQLAELQYRMTPLSFFATEYKNDLKKIKTTIETQIQNLQHSFTAALQSFRSQMLGLRKQTRYQLKKNQIETDKYLEDIHMFKEIAENYIVKMNIIKKSI